MYIENPKTKGSGIICCIPQTGQCPQKCPDCFFQGGRSFLHPLEDNLPNMPDSKYAEDYIVRVNDGNDSNVDRENVIKSTKQYKRKFYNTSIPKDLEGFGDPVVLTVNPSKMTDKSHQRRLCQQAHKSNKYAKMHHPAHKTDFKNLSLKNYISNKCLHYSCQAELMMQAFGFALAP